MTDSPRRVLLIDDDEDDYLLTRDLLAEINGGEYVLEWAADYDSGLAALCRCEHSVYLLDYRLGHRTGIDLLREAGSKSCLGPVILLTGQGEREIDLEAMEVGASDYLEKGQLTPAMFERSLRYAQVHWNYQNELERRVEQRTAELLRANQALRDSEERLRRALVNAPIPVMLLDDRETILLLSRSWLEITGYPAEELRTLEDWVNRAHSEDKPQALQNLREIIQAKPSRKTADFSIRVADGRQREWSWAVACLGNLSAGRTVFICMINDVTERNRAAEVLRDADRRKDEFLAVLAHELRNPLAPIRTGLEILKLSGDDPETADVRGMMDRQIQHMTRLIDDLLDVSRITRGKLALHKSPVELSEILQNAIEATRPFIEEGGHELSVSMPDEPVALLADPVRMAQVVANLLQNAAKYTNRGGKIQLMARRQENVVEISVKDNGIGIPADMQCHVFEMFSQVHRNMETQYTGLGIGLTLVKALVEMHDGTIDVESDGPGQGSQFTVRFPAVQQTATLSAEPTIAQSQASPLAQLRILVVDDNRDATSSIGMMLKMLGAEIELAYDGKQAVERAESFQPDVILMDLGMPKLDGYGAARLIRKQPWGQEVMMVAITGWGQEDDRLRTQAAGFDCHLVKPVNPVELKNLLEQRPRRES